MDNYDEDSINLEENYDSSSLYSFSISESIISNEDSMNSQISSNDESLNNQLSPNEDSIISHDNQNNNNNNSNFDLYQDNLNLPYINFNEDLDVFYKVNPLIFYYDFESYKNYNIGKKVLAPKSLLYNLSKYDNLEYPIHIKINDDLFTILDFIDNIDCIYVPTKKFYDLGFEENMTQVVTILKEIPPKASFLKIKPHSEKFYSIPDIKNYLEIHFNKLYLIVSKNEIIKVPFYEETLEFTITDCKPENKVSLNEIDELEIDFEPLVDVSKIEKESKKLDIKQTLNFNFKQKTYENKDENKDANKDENKDENKDKKSFVSFSGKGRKLCD